MNFPNSGKRVSEEDSRYSNYDASVAEPSHNATSEKTRIGKELACGGRNHEIMD